MLCTVVVQVPLLDMRRYNKMLAGASWMGEYGDPDVPEQWAYISKYSPYQNVFKDKKYPRVLFTTSTRDDRVHPGHARKMVAKMTDMGHDVLYYENTEGGHAGAANAVPALVVDTNSVRHQVRVAVFAANLDRVHLNSRGGDADLEVVAAAALVGDGAHVVHLTRDEVDRGCGLLGVLAPLAVGGPAGNGGDFVLANAVWADSSLRGAEPEVGVVVSGHATRRWGRLKLLYSVSV